MGSEGKQEHGELIAEVKECHSISNEDFFKPLRSVVTALKIRGSYGLVGNDKIAGARFPYLTEISLGDRKSTRLNSSHITRSRMPSSA